jgi:uncharacterized MAPEG superfamily protein
MKTELFYLSLTAAFTGLLWVPYVLDRFAVWGIPDTVGYPDNPKPQTPWARRLQKAHANAVENLVIFATLVLAANALGLSGGAIATAAIVYFWARVAHAIVYALGLPWLRTLAFTVAFFAQACVAWMILVR